MLITLLLLVVIALSRFIIGSKVDTGYTDDNYNDPIPMGGFRVEKYGDENFLHDGNGNIITHL